MVTMLDLSQEFNMILLDKDNQQKAWSWEIRHQQAFNETNNNAFKGSGIDFSEVFKASSSLYWCKQHTSQNYNWYKKDDH